MEKNITKHNFSISKEKRNKLNGHKSFCLWFTGLSGSGKSTIANRLEEVLQENINTYILMEIMLDMVLTLIYLFHQKIVKKISEE